MFVEIFISKLLTHPQIKLVNLEEQILLASTKASFFLSKQKSPHKLDKFNKLGK